MKLRQTVSLILFLGAAVSVLADPAPLPVQIASGDKNVQYVGRFDFREAGPRCSWSASAVALKFLGTDLNVRLEDQEGKNRWQVEIDGKPSGMLDLESGGHLYSVAAGLPDTSHTVNLVKATEGHVGVTQVLGFQVNQGGKLLPLPAAERRIEVIGDSISCGYGIGSSDREEHFSPKTENAYDTYGAIAARKLDADYLCVAFSGREMWPHDTLPELYERTLTFDETSRWDFSKYIPDAVIINLGTNDFQPIPDETKWTDAYKAFIKRLREHYATAMIYCVVGPMMTDASPTKPLTVIRKYLKKVVEDTNAAGDQRVHMIDFGPQKPERDGIGADWHPSKKTHEIMSDQLVSVLAKDLNWR